MDSSEGATGGLDISYSPTSCVVCRVTDLQGFFLILKWQQEISPHKICNLRSFSFPTFEQIENISWAGVKSWW